MLYVVGWVSGVTQLGDVVYVVRRYSALIKTFSVDTLSPLSKDIHVEGMISPRDIVAYDRHLYVADRRRCIWRVSVDDHSYVNWLSTTEVSTLSVTSRGLLVTSGNPPSLREYNTTDRQLLRDVKLPGYVKWLYHGVETSRGTFIIGHWGTSQSQNQDAVSELFSCHHIIDRVLSKHLLGIPPMCPKVR